MNRFDAIPATGRQFSARRANPLGLLKLTLVVSCGVAILLVLASSPKFQAAFSGEERAASQTPEETADRRITVQAGSAQTETQGFVSPSSDSAPAGTAWYGTKTVTLQDAGALLTDETERSVGTIVSTMPRNKVPVRKGGLRIFE